MKSLVINLFFFVLFASPTLPVDQHLLGPLEDEMLFQAESEKAPYNEYSFKSTLKEDKDQIKSEAHSFTEHGEKGISRKRWVY